MINNPVAFAKIISFCSAIAGREMEPIEINRIMILIEDYRFVPSNDPFMTHQVIEYIRAGKKIEAIKEYRSNGIQAGIGLKEAKDAVEAWKE